MTPQRAEAASASASVAWRRLLRVTGVAGLTALVLIFVPLVASSGQEPTFDATTAETIAFFRSVDSPLAAFGSFVAILGLVAFLWFVVGFTTLLRRAEGELPWLSTVAMASGVVFVPLVLSGSWDAAAFRADDLDPQIARYAFDEGNLSFANGWLMLGCFAVCCGWVTATTGFLPKWLGWWALVSGGGLALSRAAWTSEVWLFPYGMFWFWVIAVSVLLLRRASRSEAVHLSS